jgi:hypothetical protein
MTNSMTALVALVQGIYFATTAIWPLVHMRSFLAVTGPKTDTWLVRTVAALLAVIGAALILASGTNNSGNGAIDDGMIVVGVGSAAALLVIDVVYVIRGTIRPIYLADAAAELLLIAGWCAAPVVDR